MRSFSYSGVGHFDRSQSFLLAKSLSVLLRSTRSPVFLLLLAFLFLSFFFQPILSLLLFSLLPFPFPLPPVLSVGAKGTGGPVPDYRSPLAASCSVTSHGATCFPDPPQLHCRSAASLLFGYRLCFYLCSLSFVGSFVFPRLVVISFFGPTICLFYFPANPLFRFASFAPLCAGVGDASSGWLLLWLRVLPPFSAFGLSLTTPPYTWDGVGVPVYLPSLVCGGRAT